MNFHTNIIIWLSTTFVGFHNYYSYPVIWRSEAEGVNRGLYKVLQYAELRKTNKEEG